MNLPNSLQKSKKNPTSISDIRLESRLRGFPLNTRTLRHIYVTLCERLVHFGGASHQNAQLNL